MLTHLPVYPLVLRQVDLLKIRSCHIRQIAAETDGVGEGL